MCNSRNYVSQPFAGIGAVIDSYETGDPAREGSLLCAKLHDALKALDAGDPTSAIGRYEENIRRQEATVRGQQELAASSLDAQFASLETSVSRPKWKPGSPPSSPWTGRSSSTEPAVGLCSGPHLSCNATGGPQFPRGFP
jgi:hypothetical protein